MAKLGPNGQAFRQAVAPPSTDLDVAAMDYYWHPAREGVEHAPEDFARELRTVDRYDRVRIVRPPAGAPLYFKRAWLIWYRKESVMHPLSPGWLMLNHWRDSHDEPMPLDGRVFSYLYSVSAEAFGGAVRYFDHCVSEMRRDKAAKLATFDQGSRDRREDYRQFMAVKNIGSGNKFALHHDGTVAPSRGQANWLKERRARMIPAEVAADEQRQRESRA